MNTLKVYRDWQSAYNQTTVLKDNNNKVKAIISSSIQQPKKGSKTIIVKGIEYILDWGNVAQNKLKKKQL